MGAIKMVRASPTASWKRQGRELGKRAKIRKKKKKDVRFGVRPELYSDTLSIMGSY